MPNKVVDIDLQTATTALPRDTYSDLVIIGDEPSVGSPTYNTPRAYNDTDDVSADFGSDSDVLTAAEAAASKGVEAWWVAMAGYDTHDAELIAGSDSSAVSSGTVANTPIRGGVDNITVALDGTDQTVVPTTESPPQTPAAGEVAVNFDTGELVTGEASSGAGTGIEVTYDTLQWAELKNNMAAVELDLAVFADVRADKSYIGDLDELVTYAEGHEVSVVTAYDDLSTYADQNAAMSAYHDISAYIPSKALLAIGHGTTADVAAEQAGRLAVKPPWFDPLWDAGADYSFATDYFREALIGEPGSPNTLEGGDANEEGAVNVIKPVAGTKVLSNSLTTAGPASSYQYFDVYRTETFMADEVENALTSLRLSAEQIPFSPNGRTMLMDALRSRLRQYVASGQLQTIRPRSSQTGDGSGGSNDTNDEESQEQEVRSQTAVNRTGAPLSSLSIRVPRYDELSQTNRQNRVWAGISVRGTLASNAHTFSVTLDVQM